ncbi:hypothetical protein COU78_01670 [Candidatus Peregrinibacteria bacterium CG10_big_fil_rev_8_21_14_0_10_49_24]|nr:MAG: hypothetical protein COV83_00305 [Candidatus Peregrinibacteria bacterium CG11_big_fil_rev_8_21_14_0_20_49_14]PIR51430.1 MAG: hypothetical protein COU78_01670 [Candidatus Peregrinibacteria bacterium CG10_big_fil_rev_8_21_14_0_10_49_24]PJA67366.1 MAG: hypothetical protein CO157_04900 [Candidatus Peregrinibacteria bacterium CG_4_9_14_3_um_filter_49_12]
MKSEILSSQGTLDIPIVELFDVSRIEAETRAVAEELVQPFIKRSKRDGKLRRFAAGIAPFSTRQTHGSLGTMHGQACGVIHHDNSRHPTGRVCDEETRESNWLCAHSEQLRIIRGLVVARLQKVNASDVEQRYKEMRIAQKRQLLNVDTHGGLAYRIANGPKDNEDLEPSKRLQNVVAKSMGMQREDLLSLQPQDVSQWVETVQESTNTPTGEIVNELRSRYEVWEPSLTQAIS